MIFCSLIVGLPGVATLGGLSALGGASPPTAYALPARPPDPSDPPDTPGPPGHDTCAPQQVTGDQATLEGFMFVPDTPMVGQPTRIRISNPKIVLPDPTCDERTIGVAPTSHAWAVGTRPAGSTAIPTDLGADARLVTDRPGQWEVWYIACPNTCLIAGVVVPAQSRSVAFSPILVAEGRVSSADLLSSLQILLAGSRIQISHTGNGTPAAGPPTTYTVRWSVPAYKYHDLCDPPPTRPPTGSRRRSAPSGMERGATAR
jgi:hypothetical protein